MFISPPCFCDSLLEYDVIVSPSPASAYKHESRALCRGSLDRQRGYLLSIQKLPNSYLLSSWLPLASLSLPPPSPSLILSSCFFSLESVHKAGVALGDGSVFKFFCFWTVFARWLWLPPESLMVLVDAPLICVALTQTPLWSNDCKCKKELRVYFNLKGN